MPTLTSTAKQVLRDIQPSPQSPIHKEHPACIDTYQYGEHVIICLSGAHRDPKHMENIVKACGIAGKNHVKSLQIYIEGFELGDSKTNPSEVQAWQRIAQAMPSEHPNIQLIANPGIIKPSPDAVAQKHPHFPIEKQLLCRAEIETLDMLAISNYQITKATNSKVLIDAIKTTMIALDMPSWLGNAHAKLSSPQQQKLSAEIDLMLQSLFTRINNGEKHESLQLQQYLSHIRVMEDLISWKQLYEPLTKQLLNPEQIATAIIMHIGAAHMGLFEVIQNVLTPCSVSTHSFSAYCPSPKTPTTGTGNALTLAILGCFKRNSRETITQTTPRETKHQITTLCPASKTN